MPFAETLARMIQTRAVRARRDFKQLLTVIKTCAFLAQKHRARTADGWIQATLVDYQRARDLLVRSFDTAVGEGVTPAVRATVGAVEQGEEISETDLAERLELGKAATSYRVRRAIRGGWLKNLEQRRSYPYRLIRGDALPEDRSALPAPDRLREKWIDEAFERKARSKASSNYSNTDQTVGRERLRRSSFECSNQSQREGVDEVVIS